MVSGGYGVSYEERGDNAVLTAFTEFRSTVVSLLGEGGKVIARRTDVVLKKGEKLRVSLEGQPAAGYLFVVRQGDRVKTSSLVKR